MMISAEYETDMFRVLRRLLGRPKRIARPDKRRVERRMERMKANTISNEALVIASQVRKLDPMEEELLGRRRAEK